jgi:hypothetical protein
VRLPFAVRAVLLSGLVLSPGRPSLAQPPPPPPPPRPAPIPQMGAPRDPGRRPAAEPVGTGIIRGRVVTSDTGNPVRRANVNLVPSPPPPPPPPPGTPAGTGASATMTVVNGMAVQSGGGVTLIRPRSATTDSQGAFEFTALPPGSYRVTASAGQYSAAYLGIAYGATKPNGPGSFDPGTPIELGEGQAFEKAVIALPRGAVITGRVTDESGEALARVQVYTMFFQPGSPRGQRMGSNGQTDDLGQFRLFGLTPGEYAVVAEARGNTYVQPNAPPETEEDKIGFMTTYYPGTADEGGAQRVRARAGTETPGIEIRMVTGRLFHVSGSVVDSQGRPGARSNGNLVKRMPGMSGGSSSFGFSTDDQGRFQMRSIPPGTYRLAVRQRPLQFNSDGPSGDPGEMANVSLTVATDVDDLMIVTTPGATITGQIVFEQGPPQQMPQPLRVNASVGNPDDMMGMTMPAPALVAPDLTFTLKGMLGEFVLRAGVPNQFLKAVMMGGEDITDTPREFKSGEKVSLILTSRASALEGNVTDAKGQPSTGAGLILFSEDKVSWRMNSFRTRRSNTDQVGHYRITGLMAGRYFIAAVPRERLNALSSGADASFFELLAKEATSLVVGEDEQRQVDLKILADGGGL